MALEREDGIVACHAFTVVRDFQQPAAARFHIDDNASGARINRVLDQFFTDGGRTLNHFAGSDEVCEVVRKDADFGHS